MSSSRSSSSQATSQADNRRVIGEGGVSAENSTVIMNSLDGGAIAQAFGLAQRTLDAAGQGQAQVLDFGTDALNTVSTSQAAAFDFGADALSGALGSVDKSQARMLDFGADALSGALGSVDKSQARMLDFGADALAEAFNFGQKANVQAQAAMGDTAAMLRGAYEDAKGRGAMTDYMMIAAVLVVGLVAWGAVKK